MWVRISHEEFKSHVVDMILCRVDLEELVNMFIVEDDKYAQDLGKHN